MCCVTTRSYLSIHVCVYDMSCSHIWTMLPTHLFNFTNLESISGLPGRKLLPARNLISLSRRPENNISDCSTLASPFSENETTVLIRDKTLKIPWSNMNMNSRRACTIWNSTLATSESSIAFVGKFLHFYSNCFAFHTYSTSEILIVFFCPGFIQFLFFLNSWFGVPDLHKSTERKKNITKGSCSLRIKSYNCMFSSLSVELDHGILKLKPSFSQRK